MPGTNAAVAAPDNPAGGVTTVAALSPGEWLVRLPGPGLAAQAGGVLPAVRRDGPIQSLVSYGTNS